MNQFQLKYTLMADTALFRGKIATAAQVMAAIDRCRVITNDLGGEVKQIERKTKCNCCGAPLNIIKNNCEYCGTYF